MDKISIPDIFRISLEVTDNLFFFSGHVKNLHELEIISEDSVSRAFSEATTNLIRRYFRT